MSRQLLHVALMGLFAWALLGPAICSARCAADAQQVAELPPCHQPAEPSPAADQDEEAPLDPCCEDIGALVADAKGDSGSIGPLGSVPLVAALDPVLADRAACPAPRPPDLERSPYTRVNPPRLVYLP